MARILIADDDRSVCADLREELVKAGLGNVVVAENGEEALRQLCTNLFDLAIMDLEMPRLDGLKVLQTIRQRCIPTEVVMLARQIALQDIVQAVRLGAEDILMKPVVAAEFIEAVCRLIEKRHPSPHCLANRLNVFLREHATEGPLRLKDLCLYFHISRGYATSLFQKHIGSTFTQRLTFYRVEKAKGLLKTTNDPVYLIADQCGFKNSRRLAEAFRKQEGISPIKYRQQGGYQSPGSKER